MQKILLIMNAENPKLACIQFAASMASLSKSNLTGVFVQNTIYEDAPAVKTLGGTPYVEEITTDMLQSEEERMNLQQSIQLFKNNCSERGIDFSVHKDKGIAIQEAILESRFADYIIADAGISFVKDKQEAIPSSFLKLLLRESECPVMIAPDELQASVKLCYLRWQQILCFCYQAVCLFVSCNGRQKDNIAGNKNKRQQQQHYRTKQIEGMADLPLQGYSLRFGIWRKSKGIYV